MGEAFSSAKDHTPFCRSFQVSTGTIHPYTPHCEDEGSLLILCLPPSSDLDGSRLISASTIILASILHLSSIRSKRTCHNHLHDCPEPTQTVSISWIFSCSKKIGHTIMVIFFCGMRPSQVGCKQNARLSQHNHQQLRQEKNFQG